MKRAPHSADGRPGPARRVLNPGEPEPLLRYEFDRGSNYEQDAHVTEALLALIPDHELIGPDHRFFQVIHLVTEYAWSAMHADIRRAARGLRSGDHLLAVTALDRAVGLGTLPVTAVRLMARHLPQYGLLTMREVFPGNTTGLDSPGARNLRRGSLALWRAFESALERAGLVLVDLTRASRAEIEQTVPAPALRELTLVRDRLQALDLSVQEWKHVHLRLVWAQLGGHPDAGGDAEPGSEDERGPLPTSLRGRPISDLERMAGRTLFPALWHEADMTYSDFDSGAPDRDRDIVRPAGPAGTIH